MKFTVEWPVGEYRKVAQTIEFTNLAVSDMRPVFDNFRKTLRMRHRQTMDTMADPLTGQPWTPLLPEYAATKPAGTQGRILYRFGMLRRALTVFRAPWSVYQATKQSMVWGIDAPAIYPTVHQTTARSRKDGRPLRRGFMGMKLPDDLLTLKKFVQTHIIGMQAKAIKGGTFK